MTMQSKENVRDAGKEGWTAPSIKCVVPLSHTRGGFGPVNDQDDVFYKTS